MVNGKMLPAGFCLPSFKSAWDPVYPEQNRNVREILSNLIGYLEDWELEKTDNLRKMETPGMVYNPTYSIQPFSFWKTHAREFQGMFFLLFLFLFFLDFTTNYIKKRKVYHTKRRRDILSLYKKILTLFNYFWKPQLCRFPSFYI